MTRWKTRLKATNVLLIVFILGNEMVDCHSRLSSAMQFRGSIHFKKPKELVSSSFFDGVERSSEGGNATDAGLLIAICRMADCRLRMRICRNGVRKSYLAQRKPKPKMEELRAMLARAMRSYLAQLDPKPKTKQLVATNPRSGVIRHRHAARSRRLLAKAVVERASPFIVPQEQKSICSYLIKGHGRRVAASLFSLSDPEMLAVGAAALFVFGAQSAMEDQEAAQRDSSDVQERIAGDAKRIIELH